MDICNSFVVLTLEALDKRCWSLKELAHAMTNQNNELYIIRKINKSLKCKNEKLFSYKISYGHFMKERLIFVQSTIRCLRNKLLQLF